MKLTLDISWKQKNKFYCEIQTYYKIGDEYVVGSSTGSECRISDNALEFVNKDKLKGEYIKGFYDCMVGRSRAWVGEFQMLGAHMKKIKGTTKKFVVTYSEGNTNRNLQSNEDKSSL